MSTAAGLLLAGGAEATNGADEPISRPTDILISWTRRPVRHVIMTRMRTKVLHGRIKCLCRDQNARDGYVFLLGYVYTHASLGTGSHTSYDIFLGDSACPILAKTVLTQDPSLSTVNSNSQPETENRIHRIVCKIERLSIKKASGVKCEPGFATSTRFTAYKRKKLIFSKSKKAKV